MIRKFQTNLRCVGCVNTITPLMNSEPGIQRWSADVSGVEKVLTIEGDDISGKRVGELLGRAGYQVIAELPVDSPPTHTPHHNEPPTSYYPLALVVGYILLVVVLVELSSSTIDWSRAMTNFMAGFFLVFSFFKLLDVTAFADSYQMYDLVGARSRRYALAYPFIELLLGIAYLIHIAPLLINVVTLVVMLIGTAGVARTLLDRRKIRCACLGAVFNLPMSAVTLVEDGLMAVMAAMMLIGAI